MSELPLRVLLYSDERAVRDQVRLALGRKVAADLPDIVIEEAATQAAVIRAADAGGYSLFILDAEAAPSGGMGIAYQLKDEIADCPPVLLLVARVADAWLATWARAEAISPFPVDPLKLPDQVADLLRRRLASTAA